jgi:hypothetical protein
VLGRPAVPRLSGPRRRLGRRANWTLGHWLNGRAGIAPLPELIAALAQRAGAAIDPGEAGGAIVGYVIDRPMRLRDALAPLLEAFALEPVERQDGVVLAGRSGLAALTLGDDDLAWPEDRARRSPPCGP